MVRHYHVWVGRFRDYEPRYLEQSDTGRVFLPSQFLRDIGVTWHGNRKTYESGPPYKGGTFWSPRTQRAEVHVREMVTETTPYTKRAQKLGRSSKYLEWGRGDICVWGMRLSGSTQLSLWRIREFDPHELGLDSNTWVHFPSAKEGIDDAP